MVRSCRACSAFMFARRRLAAYQISAYKIFVVSLEYHYVFLLSYLFGFSSIQVISKKLWKNLFDIEILMNCQLHPETDGICGLMISAHDKTRGRRGDSATILRCFPKLQYRFHRRLDHTCDQ
jgi:hypothetical protein